MGSGTEDQVSNFHFALHAGITETWETGLPRQQEISRVLCEITDNARSQLIGGATAIDVVQAAALAMEDYPLFNAGKGAMLNEAREHEVRVFLVPFSIRREGLRRVLERPSSSITRYKESCRRSCALRGVGGFFIMRSLRQSPR